MMNIKFGRMYLGLVVASFSLGNANAALIALKYGSTIDSANQEVTFFINFNETPNFFAIDSAGRQADSFQYFVDTDALSATPNQFTAESIVRGGEIHIDGDVREYAIVMATMVPIQIQVGGGQFKGRCHIA